MSVMLTQTLELREVMPVERHSSEESGDGRTLLTENQLGALAVVAWDIREIRHQSSSSIQRQACRPVGPKTITPESNVALVNGCHWLDSEPATFEKYWHCEDSLSDRNRSANAAAVSSGMHSTPYARSFRRSLVRIASASVRDTSEIKVASECKPNFASTIARSFDESVTNEQRT